MVVPVLINALKDEDKNIRRNAAYALARIGKDAVPALITALKDEDSDVRSNAADALGKIGADAKEAVPVLITALKDEDNYVRSNAADALGNIGTGAKEAVPALITALKDEDYYVRTSTAEALGKIGKEAKSAVPALRAALQGANAGGLFRYITISAIARIKGDLKDASANLIEAIIYDDYCLTDSTSFTYNAIVPALVQIRQEAVPVIVTALQDKNEEIYYAVVGRAVARALGQIGADARIYS